MKKLPRNPMHPEKEARAEVEIWQPSWKCFCCHDSGIVAAHLAAMAIEGFNSNRDRFPRCQNPGCKSGSHWDSENITNCVDYRLSPATCQELDAAEREAWQKTVLMQCQHLKARLNELREQEQKLAQKMKMPGVGDRTANDNREVAIRHEEIKNADSQKLTAAAHFHLGNDYWEGGAS